jgi:hypothetical protein
MVVVVHQVTPQAADGAHEPAVHRQLVVEAPQLLVEAVADLGSDDCRPRQR